MFKKINWKKFWKIIGISYLILILFSLAGPGEWEWIKLLYITGIVGMIVIGIFLRAWETHRLEKFKDGSDN